jgi:hypothetical protein
MQATNSPANNSVPTQPHLCTVSEDCKHGKTAILDLVELQLLHLSLGLATKVEQVEPGAT